MGRRVHHLRAGGRPLPRRPGHDPRAHGLAVGVHHWLRRLRGRADGLARLQLRLREVRGHGHLGGMPSLHHARLRVHELPRCVPPRRRLVVLLLRVLRVLLLHVLLLLQRGVVR